MYPSVYDKSRVGKYPGLAKAGGGFVWDEVLEYRVWCYPSDGAEDLEGGSDYYYSFDDCEAAIEFSKKIPGAQEPLALILQREYIDEPQPGNYVHRKEERITEWPIDFLTRPKRTALTIPLFLAPSAPANRLDIIRGLK